MAVGTKELKEYMGIVVDMETNIFLMKQAEKELEGQERVLAIPTAIQDPKPPVMPARPEMPKSPEMENTVKNVFAFLVFPIIAFPWAVGIALLVLFVLTYADEHEALFWLIVIGVLILLIAAAVAHTVSENKTRKKRYKAQFNAYLQQCAQQKQVYEKQKQAYEKQIKNNQLARERDKNDRVRKDALVKVEIKHLQGYIQETRERLDNIYARNVIFPKYRNLPMVCSLYEYLCAGRCNSLEGHEGAYNILEMEIRMDRVILQLDRIISMLGTIQENQYTLYSAIQESNRKVNQILCSTQGLMQDLMQSLTSSMDKMNNSAQIQKEELEQKIVALEKTSALTAYHTERVQKELAYMNRMDYLTGRNDGVPYNHPPI